MIDRTSLYSATKPANTMLKKPTSTQGWIFTGSLLSALFGGLVGGLLLANTQVSMCHTSAYADSWMCSSIPKPVALPVPEPVVVEVRSTEVVAEETPVNTSWAMIRKHGLNVEVLKPVAMELAAIAIFQALGVRVLRRTKTLVTKWMPNLVKGLNAPSSKKIIYHITKIYKKTHASKVVTRTKKYLKHFQHIKHMDEHHDSHHGEHHDGEHHQEQEQMEANPLGQRKYFLE